MLDQSASFIHAMNEWEEMLVKIEKEKAKKDGPTEP